MLRLFRRRIGLFTIASILLAAVIPPNTRAQRNDPLFSAAPAPQTISSGELKSRRAAIENMETIDEAVKAESLKNIDLALSYLELAKETRQKTDELAKLVKTAPEQLKRMSVELKKPLPTSEHIEAHAPQLGMAELEQRLAQSETELARARVQRKEWSDRLIEKRQLTQLMPEQLAGATRRFREIQNELQHASDGVATDVLEQSRRLRLVAEQQKLAADIRMKELRQSDHSLLVELFRMKQDVARREIERHEQTLRIWQAEIQKRRLQEIAQAREDAQNAIIEMSLLPKTVQDQFDINIQLSLELEEIVGKEAELEKRYDSYQSRLRQLEEAFETARKRVESKVMTEVIGLTLRAQRLNLPDVKEFAADADALRSRLAEISERQIALEQLQSECADIRGLTDRVIGGVAFESDADRKSLELKIEDLVSKRFDMIQQLKSGHERRFKLIQDIELTKKKLTDTTEDFGELLDRHLLWIRSSKPVSRGDIESLSVGVRWFFSPVYWKQLVKDTGQSIRRKPFLFILGLAIVLALLTTRRWTRRRLKTIAEKVRQQEDDSFLLTIRAAALTALLTALWPAILAFPAIQLKSLHPPEPFSAIIAEGLLLAVVPLVFAALTYNLCVTNGLVQVHFQWPESARRTLKSNLGWLIPILTVTSFLLGVMESVKEYEYSDAIAKLAIMVQTVATLVFAAHVLRFKGGVTSVLIDKHPHGWLSRLRYVWYPLAIFWPLSFLLLAMMGYYYSAIELRLLFGKTYVLFLALIIFYYSALRLLTLTRRRIAAKKIAERQKLHRETHQRKEKKADMGRSSVTQPSVTTSDIDEQTRALLHLTVFILAITGIWKIWAPVFPAFGILQDIEFWSYTTAVNGIEKTVPINLASIVMAFIVAVTTVVAVRNLPGLLEIVLLNRLPMDPGARYAYSTVCRYLITAIGISVVLHTVGIQWSKLQWLIAALSVGLGFGLQEIVANFVSGLIVLFERPFRLGDTVTIGDVSGTVTRIQIRATTILDWDRKELIVPNKEFITGKLINWSLSDSIVRIKVPVGIAYGSDTELAERTLLKAAETNPLVLKSPEPTAVFLRFGDNSLDFEVRVYIRHIDDWIPMLHTLNRTIDDKFREAGITIAFPQRDVHLDAAGPLDVRVVAAPSHNAADPAAEPVPVQPATPGPQV